MGVDGAVLGRIVSHRSSIRATPEACAAARACMGLHRSEWGCMRGMEQQENAWSCTGANAAAWSCTAADRVA
eukprot:362905-Chlamydomonas_euryale.AAC.6